MKSVSVSPVTRPSSPFRILGLTPRRSLWTRVAIRFPASSTAARISWILAFRHSWRWGAHVRREDARRFLDGSARGQFNFSNISDFEAGRVNTATLLFGSTLAYWQRYPWDLYWQDSYKVKDNLTLNYGVRYEYPSAIHQVR